jgi:plasmid maintenance system antidote protein VapI
MLITKRLIKPMHPGTILLDEFLTPPASRPSAR